MAWIERSEYHTLKHSPAAVRKALADLGLDPDRYVKVKPRRSEGWPGYELTQDDTCTPRPPAAPAKLVVGQAWDDDRNGTQRVITGFPPGRRVTYKVEVRHPLRGVEWVEQTCNVGTFWTWVRRNRAIVR